METAEKIYEIVKAMPEAQASEVLDFAEFLKQKLQSQQGQTLRNNQLLIALPSLEGFIPPAWKEAIYQ